MKSRAGKTAALFIISTVALAGIGAGYAMWSETVYINGTINSGWVYAYWTSCFNFDLPGENDPYPDGTRGPKNVGTTICEIDPVDPRILHVTVTNAYPCYFNDCEVEYTIGGTVPVKIQSIDIIPDGFTLASAYGANDGEIWVELVNGIGSQHHPGDICASSFKFHVEQCAEQLHTYEFDVAIQVVQYNEYQP